MKKSKKLSALVVMLAAVLIVSGTATKVHAAANSGWTIQQEIAHQIAELARSLNLPESHPIIAISKDIWWAIHDGQSLNSIGSYTSNRTGETFGAIDNSQRPTQITATYNGYQWYRDYEYTSWYRWSGSSKVSASNNDSVALWNTWATWNADGNLTATYNGYSWTWEKSSAAWYRWNGSSKYYASSTSDVLSIWNTWFQNARNNNTGTTGYTGNTGGNNTTGGTTLGNAAYNYNMFTGYNWYNGVISGPSDSWIDEQAKILVGIAAPYTRNNPSQTKQAQVMWLAINIANGGDVKLATSSFPKYDANASYTDSNNRSMLALARDVMWRYTAEKNGYTSNGRCLSSDMTRMSVTGNEIVFRNESGGTYNNALKSPYAS